MPSKSGCAAAATAACATSTTGCTFDTMVRNGSNFLCPTKCFAPFSTCDTILPPSTFAAHSAFDLNTRFDTVEIRSPCLWRREHKSNSRSARATTFSTISAASACATAACMTPVIARKIKVIAMINTTAAAAATRCAWTTIGCLNAVLSVI